MTLTDLTDLCDGVEMKSVYQLQDRGKKTVCLSTKLLIGLTYFSGGVLYEQMDGTSNFFVEFRQCKIFYYISGCVNSSSQTSL